MFKPREDGSCPAAPQAIDRRAAIKALLGAATACALGAAPRALAASSTAMSRLTTPPTRPTFDRLALLSDPHIHADPDKHFWGADLSGNFSDAVARVLAGPRPSAVIVNGDCALDDGGLDAYTQFHRLLQPFRAAGMPVHCTLGNHDHRGRFYEVFAHTFPTAGMPLQRCVDVVERHHADWYLLDSLRETDETPGELGVDQTRWLLKRLDAKPGRAAVVVLHHPPGSKNQGYGGSGLDDGESLMRHLRRRTQVKAVVYGHLHRFEHHTDRGLHLIGLPATSYVLRPGGWVGFVEALMSRDELVLTTRCLASRTKRDGKVTRLTLR